MNLMTESNYNPLNKFAGRGVACNASTDYSTKWSAII